MTDKLQIFNMALQNIGQNLLNSVNEDTKEAKELSLRYDSCRRFVLSSHRWSFAMKRMLLNADAETPAFNWQYQYQLPVDCLKVVSTKNNEASKNYISNPIIDETKVSGLAAEQPDDFIVEGKKILTNLSSMGIIYIADIIDESLFSQGFVDALSYYLAYAVSERLKGSANNDMLTMYQNQISTAKTTDAQQGKVKIRRQFNFVHDYL